MLYTIYGKHSQDYDSQIVKDMHAYARHCFRVIGPGALPPVDIFPFLKWIPERWANWKIECQVARKMQRSLFFGLLDECEQTDGHCYMREIIQKRDELGFTDRDMLRYLSLFNFKVFHSWFCNYKLSWWNFTRWWYRYFCGPPPVPRHVLGSISRMPKGSLARTGSCYWRFATASSGRHRKLTLRSSHYSGGTFLSFWFC